MKKMKYCKRVKLDTAGVAHSKLIAHVADEIYRLRDMAAGRPHAAPVNVSSSVSPAPVINWPRAAPISSASAAIFMPISMRIGDGRAISGGSDGIGGNRLSAINVA